MPAVGSVVVTKTRLTADLQLISIAWTSAAGGGVSGNPFTVGAGYLWEVQFIPGVGGTQPSNAYTVQLMDPNNCDFAVAKGVGAGLSNVNPSLGIQQGPLSILVGGTIDCVVVAAGNAKSGTVNMVVGVLRG